MWLTNFIPSQDGRCRWTIVKSVDETSNRTTLALDAELKRVLLPNTKYYIYVAVRSLGTAGDDVRIRWDYDGADDRTIFFGFNGSGNFAPGTLAESGTYQWGLIDETKTVTSSVAVHQMMSDATPPYDLITVLQVHGVLITGSNGGTFGVSWRSADGVGGDATIQAGSILYIETLP